MTGTTTTPGPTPGPDPTPQAGPARATEPPPARVRRPRSPRTAPTAVVVVVALITGGALLYDVVAVRTDHPARQWRTDLADELQTRHLDDLWVLIGAGAAVLLGALLLWWAIAPGLRRWLPLRPPPGTGATQAVIDRAGVGALLLTRAGEVPGVEHTTVRINRRRARVTVTGPADPAAVQRTLAAELERIALARPPALAVRTPGRGRG